MTPGRYREQSLADAANAAGAAFGAEEPVEPSDDARVLDLRGIASLAAGLGILATLAFYLLA